MDQTEKRHWNTIAGGLYQQIISHPDMDPAVGMLVAKVYVGVPYLPTRCLVLSAFLIQMNQRLITRLRQANLGYDQYQWN